MSSANKTANYKLSQFIGTDKPTFLGDYNNDMQIIDGAIFEANQSAEQALNDVEAVKGAQVKLKNVHTETQGQVARIKEIADGMSVDVTSAQEAANSAEQKATEAQTASTAVLNAANAASANATKAKQTADGNKTTLTELEKRIAVLESKPSEPAVTPITLELSAVARGNGDDAHSVLTITDNKYTTVKALSANNGNSGTFTIKGRNLSTESWTALGTIKGNALPSAEVNLQNKKIVFLDWSTGALSDYTGTSITFDLK